MRSPHLDKAPDQPDPNGAAYGLQRDASNFDFRIVTLLLVLVTRADMLKEYLDDGKAKDARKVPLALYDRNKWKTLRTLFEPAMLAEMLYLWEIPCTQASALQLRRVFQTMINLEEYDSAGCPNSSFVKAIVDYSAQQSAELDPAGVASDEGSEN